MTFNARQRRKVDMEFKTIDFDESKSKAALTKREKIVIYILGIIINIVAPVKFTHQLQNMMEQILGE